MFSNLLSRKIQTMKITIEISTIKDFRKKNRNKTLSRRHLISILMTVFQHWTKQKTLSNFQIVWKTIRARFLRVKGGKLKEEIFSLFKIFLKNKIELSIIQKRKKKKNNQIYLKVMGLNLKSQKITWKSRVSSKKKNNQIHLKMKMIIMNPKKQSRMTENITKQKKTTNQKNFHIIQNKKNSLEKKKINNQSYLSWKNRKKK